MCCAFGMIYQQYSIIKQYHQYKVNTATVIYTPSTIKPLGLTFCLASNVINITQVNLHAGSKWKNNTNVDSIVQNTTAFVLFRSTPDPRDVVNYVQTGYVYLNVKNLSIYKFLFGWSLCYHIQNLYMTHPGNGTSVGDGAIKGVMGSIALTPQLSKTTGIRFTFNSKEGIPYRGISMSRFLHRSKVVTGQVQVPFIFQSHHYVIDMIRLPSPYETDCFDYKKIGLNDDVECVYKCFLTVTLKKYQAIGVPAFVLEPLNYTTVNYSDHNTWKKMLELRKECEKQCLKPPCNDSQVVTLVDNGLPGYLNASSSNQTKISLWHLTPDFPFFDIKSRPAQSLTDLVLFIFSIISTWTGVSIISLNPLRIVDRFVQVKIQEREDVNQRIATNHDLQSRVVLLEQSSRDLGQDVAQLKLLNGCLLHEVRLIKDIIRATPRVRRVLSN